MDDHTVPYIIMHGSLVNGRPGGSRVHALEHLALDIAAGRVDPAKGRRTAAGLVTTGDLDAPGLYSWLRTATWLARQEDLWERALLLGDLLAAALAALPDDPRSRDLALCRSEWTELVHLGLVHRPDAALFRSAVREGRAALDTARLLGDDAFAGHVLYRLGILHLDPFSRPRDLWWEEHRLWLSLAPAERTEGLPEPREALPVAERLLGEAAARRSGPGLGYTLKAWAQALQQLEFLGLETPGNEDVDGLCERALLLIPGDDVTALAAVEALRSGRR
jgi:hypothetical protein